MGGTATTRTERFEDSWDWSALLRRGLDRGSGRARSSPLTRPPLSSSRSYASLEVRFDTHFRTHCACSDWCRTCPRTFGSQGPAFRRARLGGVLEVLGLLGVGLVHVRLQLLRLGRHTFAVGVLAVAVCSVVLGERLALCVASKLGSDASALHSLEAFFRAAASSAASSAVCLRTQRLMLWYSALKASRVASLLPRSALHCACAACCCSCSAGGLAAAAAGSTRRPRARWLA